MNQRILLLQLLPWLAIVIGWLGTGEVLAQPQGRYVRRNDNRNDGHMSNHNHQQGDVARDLGHNKHNNKNKNKKNQHNDNNEENQHNTHGDDNKHDDNSDNDEDIAKEIKEAESTFETSVRPQIKSQEGVTKQVVTRSKIASLPMNNVPVERTCAPRYPSCLLRDTDQWGVPVVYITQGRSGSQSIWAILTQLVSYEAQGIKESVGTNPHDIKAFLKDHEAGGKCWLVEILCRGQAWNRYDYRQSHQRATLYGTKWKPYGFNSTAARAALTWVARDDSNKNVVKVVYSERNPLDVYLSKLKHDQHHVSSHCTVDDAKCIQKHLDSQVRIHPDKLLSGLHQVVQIDQVARDLLEELHVPHIQVSYEELFYPANGSAAEWQRLIDYLGVAVPPSMQPLTMDGVHNATLLAATSDHNRSAHVENYDELVDTLRGTEYEKYLNY